MDTILCIETSTKICSVALQLPDGQCILRIDETPQVHGTQLSPMIDAIMKEADVSYESLAAIACSQGPGSYTGLRIAYATAKGLSMPFQTPMIEVPTLQILAEQAKLQRPIAHGTYIPMIHAGRKEYYVYTDLDAAVVAEQAANIVGIEPDARFFQETKEKFENPIFVGTNLDVLQPLIPEKLDLQLLQVAPLAQAMVSLAQEAMDKGSFASTASCVPFYFKAPNITKSKKTILNS